MPRKKDQLVAVLDYFETAPLSDALLALSVVKRNVARRTEVPVSAGTGVGSEKAKPKKRAARKPKATASAVPTTQPTLN